jgi:hypothetical protein
MFWFDEVGSWSLSHVALNKITILFSRQFAVCGKTDLASDNQLVVFFWLKV